MCVCTYTYVRTLYTYICMAMDAHAHFEDYSPIMHAHVLRVQYSATSQYRALLDWMAVLQSLVSHV